MSDTCLSMLGLCFAVPGGRPAARTSSWPPQSAVAKNVSVSAASPPGVSAAAGGGVPSSAAAWDTCEASSSADATRDTPRRAGVRADAGPISPNAPRTGARAQRRQVDETACNLCPSNFARSFTRARPPEPAESRRGCFCDAARRRAAQLVKRRPFRTLLLAKAPGHTAGGCAAAHAPQCALLPRSRCWHACYARWRPRRPPWASTWCVWHDWNSQQGTGGRRVLARR